jgi:hypothetical protein
MPPIIAFLPGLYSHLALPDNNLETVIARPTLSYALGGVGSYPIMHEFIALFSALSDHHDKTPSTRTMRD